MDVENRELGLPRVAASALAELSPQEHALLDAYARGVNAFMESHRRRLPLEFLLLWYQPQPWREIDSIAVALNLATNLSHTWTTDLMRERVAARLEKDLLPDVFPDHSPYDVPVAEVAPSPPACAKISSADRLFDVIDSGDCRLSMADCRLSQSNIDNLQSAMAWAATTGW